MRSKAPLLLMEQMVMLLVFALAAALCLQAFVKSDGLSGDSESRDRAVTLCQEAAEVIRRSGSAGAGGTGEVTAAAAEKLGYHCEHAILWQDFDEDWNPMEYGVYRLEAEGVPTQVPGMEAAHVSVVKWHDEEQELEVLFELDVAWQTPVMAEVEVDDGTAG